MGDQNLWTGDTALREWTQQFGAGWAVDHFASVGEMAGADDTFEKARQANRSGPELRAYDRYGMRVDQIEFHPAWHDLMALAIENKMHNFAWHHEGNGGHAGQSALTYMFSQPEGGVMCPMAMTYSAVPALRATPEIAAQWIPRILSLQYDRRDIPVAEKSGATIGMFMTEKQGGSDVRANTTSATPMSNVTGAGAQYLLTGHKYFCSAPMCDAFLVLAGTQDSGISCFLVPRWKPNGERNSLFIQRIKEKLGNVSNASTEIELNQTWGVMLGEEGRGIRTIIDMVNGNRLYCAMSSAGIMRQALVQAMHHTAHRRAFGKRLIEQPLMKNVLADMAIEVEAAVALGMRVAHALDTSSDDPQEAAFARIGTAIAKFWITKRCPAVTAEALECHGGPGYIEDSIMPRLYREAPLNSIWEGSGNVMGLDVYRAVSREPQTVSALFTELEKTSGQDANFDHAVMMLRRELDKTDGMEGRMRTVAELMALTLQGMLLIQHAPDAVAQAFCASRLNPGNRGTLGTLPDSCDLDAILSRASPV